MRLKPKEGAKIKKMQKPKGKKIAKIREMRRIPNIKKKSTKRMLTPNLGIRISNRK
jgi:hypothetical protein